MSADGEVVTWPPEPAALDYSALPQPAAVLVLLLGGAALVGAALLARFLDVSVLRPPWTRRQLPCENVLYLLFSVAVADVLQAGCVLVRGVQLLMAHWFMSRPLCKLWSLLEAVAVTARLFFLLAINGRLLRDGHWSRPLKVWLVLLLWLLVTASAYLLVRAVGVRRDHTCGPHHVNYVPAASLWRYVMVNGAGLALLPVAGGVYLWYRGRPLGGSANPETEGVEKTPVNTEEAAGANGSGGSTVDEVATGKDELQTEATAQDVSKHGSEGASAAVPPRSPQPPGQRPRKLERLDTYTPSTFTINKFWGMPSVDEMSASSGYTELGRNGSDDEQEVGGDGHHCVTLHQVMEVRRRVHLFVMILSLTHFSFSLCSFGVDMFIEWKLTETHHWMTTAKVFDLGCELQPLATTFIFSIMFPRWRKLLCTGA